MPKADLGFIDQPFALSTDLPDVHDTPGDEDLLVLAERALVLMRAERDQYAILRSVGAIEGSLSVERLKEIERSTRNLLRRVGKLRAHTPAGLYAKAQLVSGSRTGAAILAKSLAADMIEMPGLRQRLWPAAVV